MPIDITNKEEKQIALTGAEIESALLKANSITSSASEIDSAITKVINTRVDTSYPVDFTTLTSSGVAGSTYFNNVPLVKEGVLKELRIKTYINTTLKLYAYSITNNGSGVYTFTKLHEFGTFIADSTEFTIEITDDYIIPTGSFIGVYSDSNFYHKVQSNSSFRLGASAIQNAIMAFDFNIQTGTAEIPDNIDTLLRYKKDILELQNAYITLKKTNLFQTNFTDLSAFTSVNWTASGNKAKPSVLGINNYLWLNKRYHTDNISYDFQIKLYSDTVAVFQFYSSIALGYGKIRIDVPNNKLEITAYGGDGVIASRTLGFSISSGEVYRVQLKRVDGWKIDFNLFDNRTTTITTASYGYNISSLNTENRMMDTIRFYQSAGLNFIELSNFNITTSKNPLLALYGDSITEGIYFSTATYESRYPILLKNKLKGNIVISARSGATIDEVIEKMTTELPFIKPTYTMVTIGTNIGNTPAKLATLIGLIKANDSIPIINHIPNKSGGGHISVNAEIDTACNTNGAIIGALFDVATSIGNIPTNSYITSDYFDAGVHPNANGQINMYNRILIDCPYLF